MLAESVEVLTAIVVIWYQEHDQIEIEQDVPEEILEGSTSILLDETTPPTGWKVDELEGSKMITPPMRLSRAESMRRIREGQDDGLQEKAPI